MVKDGTVTAEDGTICGGDNTWDKILKLCRDGIGLSHEDTASLYFESPAKCLGITDRGKIEVGRRADLVLMDRAFHVLRTIIKGETVYEAE